MSPLQPKKRQALSVTLDANKLIECRAKTDFTQEQLAEKADLSVISIIRAEAEKRISVNTARSIASALNVHYETLIKEASVDDTQRNMHTDNLSYRLVSHNSIPCATPKKIDDFFYTSEDIIFDKLFSSDFRPLTLRVSRANGIITCIVYEHEIALTRLHFKFNHPHDSKYPLDVFNGHLPIPSALACFFDFGQMLGSDELYFVARGVLFDHLSWSEIYFRPEEVPSRVINRLLENRQAGKTSADPSPSKPGKDA